MVADAKKTVAEIKAFIKAKDILRLPDPDRCQIIEMPEFQRGNSTAYLNPAPPLDPKASSFYAVSPPPRDWDARRVKTYLEEYNRHMLQILTIHEAYPGHYVQLEYSNRHPSLIRQVLSSGMFAEGWAVYTEQMMLDQGYGNGDLALRLHQLKFYLRAVINAILDHKMHCDEHDRRGGAGAPRRRRRSSPKARRSARSSAPSRVRASSRPTSSAARRSTGCGNRCSANWATRSTSAATTRRCWPTARCR